MSPQLRWCYDGPPGARRDNFMRIVSRCPSAIVARCNDASSASWSDTDIDAVYLSVPFEERARRVEQLISIGTPVLCEGPITADPAVGCRIRDMSLLNAVPVVETAPFQHHPQHDFVIDLLRSGVIGEVSEIRAQLSASLLTNADDEPDPDWHDGWEAANTVLRAVRTLLDCEPQSAVGWCDEDERGVASGFSGVLLFQEGYTASVMWSVDPGYGAGYVMVGSMGTIEVPHAFLPFTSEFGAGRVVIRTDTQGKRFEHRFGPVDSDRLGLEGFADSLSRPWVFSSQPNDISINANILDLMRTAKGRPATRQGVNQWNLSRSA